MDETIYLEQLAQDGRVIHNSQLRMRNHKYYKFPGYYNHSSGYFRELVFQVLNLRLPVFTAVHVI